MSEERKITPKRFAVRPERFEKLWRRFLDNVEKARKINAELELETANDNEEIEQCVREANIGTEFFPNQT